MEKVKISILVKIVLDLAYILIILTSFFVTIFSYDERLSIYLSKVSDTHLEETKILFPNYMNQMCIDNEATFCDYLKYWQAAGIYYLVFSSLSLVFCMYVLLRCSLRYADKDALFSVKYDLDWYIYPTLGFFAVFLYIIISGIFTTEFSYEYEGLTDEKVTIEAGLILMIAAFLISFISAIYFLVERKKFEQKSDLEKPFLKNYHI
ncbi:unnamed protein product [Blepharisma stoltei]|uniref:Uncharacterized protein n=1 Tax=Blepharisma stoltei TaxID=1481888 RepID=A0AAU9JL40_9CILI|nr:unnamed protein product [Blepharisma stoltei]